MKRTRWLQETKQMRFEEAYDGWRNRRLTQSVDESPGYMRMPLIDLIPC